MHEFQGKTVRSLTKILNTSGSAKKIRLTVPVDEQSSEILKKIGFDDPVLEGDYLIPSNIGTFTNFNTNGNEIIRKDLPKESQSIMFHGKHRDWQGNLTPKIFTKTIKKYPRELIPGPSQTLEIIAIKNKLFVSTSEIDLNSGDKILNLHIINLMLECFNEFEIFDVDLADIVSLRIRRLQWDILPPGEYPWEISRNLIYKITDQPNFIDKEVIEHRMKMISKRDPDFLAVGKAGFNGYFVYGFYKKGYLYF